MRTFLLSLFFLLTCLNPLQLCAEEPAIDSPYVDDLLSSLNPQMGIIDLPNGVAQLDVPEEFRYIGPEAAQRFLEDGWGNPDGSGTLGMLLPVDTELFGPEGWGVVITYEEDGHVEDDDAADINYTELLTQIRDGEKELNKERKELGFEPIHIVGWAAPPHYDSRTKKLYWAKELRFGDDPEHTLNYNVRILGRKGVLILNAVASIDQLPAITDSMQQVLAFSDFKDGHRYSDYDSGVDKVAAYGIAALVGGKVAAKVGLLAKLGALLFAFKKFIIIGLAAFGGVLAKLFGRRKDSGPTLPPSLGE